MKIAEFAIQGVSGLGYSAEANAFVVVSTPGTAEVTFLNEIERMTASVNIGSAINDPLNTVFNNKANSLLFFDNDASELIEVKMIIENGRKPSVETTTRFPVPRAVLQNAKGMAIDPGSGELFILDAEGPRIVRIVPDANGRIDGSAFQRDGAISHIIIKSLPGAKLQGIAFNPGDGHFYAMDPSEQKLYEVSGQGEVVSTRDVSSFGFRAPEGMVFAPSGDRTDDPANQTLYLVDRGLNAGKGDIIELALVKPKVIDLSMFTEETVLIQTILTSNWSPPSPDPSGLTYIPTTNRLMVSDGEVEEMPIYAGANVYESSFSGNLLSAHNTLSFSDEPTGVAYNPNNHHLYFSDDTGSRWVFEMNPGPDGQYWTSDDIITSFVTNNFQSNDPEGITYNTFNGHLYIADGVNAEIYDVNPGNNGKFDGVPPSGDDIVTHFDTAVLGLSDPEGVEFNTDNGNLYIVSNANSIVVETTTSGSPVRVIDISSLNAKAPAGLAYAPSSINPAVKSLYIAARGVDNNNNPNENDGKIYEIALGAQTPTLVINDVSVTEGDAGTVNAVFTVSLTVASNQSVTVNYATQNGTATAGNDYASTSGSLTFSPGATSRQVTVQVYGDELEEVNETFVVNLSNPNGATIGDGQGLGTIMDDDGLQPTSVTFRNGLNGYNGARDTKLLANSPSVNNGSATTLDMDGNPDESSLLYWDLSSIPAGSNILSATITVNITSKTNDEYELYELKRAWVESQATWNQYATGQNWQVAGASGSGDRGSTVLGTVTGPATGSRTITLNANGIALVQSWINNPASNYGLIIMDYVNSSDGGSFSSREATNVASRPALTISYAGSSEPSITINDVTVTEGNTGTVNALFTVSLSHAGDQVITVDYATANGTATAGSDYNSAASTLTFQVGETSKTITVQVKGDMEMENNETFLVNLSNPANAAIGDAQGVGTITDDDTQQSLSINDVAVTEGNSGTVNAVFTVSLSASSSSVVTVDYTTADETATTGDDYNPASGTLTFQVGETSKTITVQVKGDMAVENNETFQVNLSNQSNAAIQDGQGIGTIRDDDGTVTVSFQNGVNGYSGTRDTRLYSDNPTKNYGTENTLKVDGDPDRSSLISWDLSSIPAGSTVESVQITITVTSSSKVIYELYELKRPWVEAQATWNQYASGQNWQVGGANGSADRGSAELASINARSTGAYTFSLNAAGLGVVQSWIDNPSSNYGFVIMDFNSTDGLTFSSREASAAADRPKLTITYNGGQSNNMFALPSSAGNGSGTAELVLPETVSLKGNYPNPFNLETRIEYALPADARVSLTIYNIRGQRVRTLVDQFQSAGFRSAVWNGRDDFGQVVSSGIYFIQLLADQQRLVSKMILQK